MRHKVYLIGAGPGEPGLITVRGQEILHQAEVVIYDYLVDKRILDYARPDAQLICCDKLGQKRYSNGFLLHQEKISQLVLEKVKAGKKVVRLKNGDVSLFSRTTQELEPLVKNRIEFELVPGIPAANAASAFSGIPLTDRRLASSCLFVTGHEDPQKKETALDWQALAKNGTIVLYMAVENLGKIARELMSAGKPPHTPAAIIQNASLCTQKTLIANLKEIAQKAEAAKIRPPAIVIIGEAVRLEKKFNWLKKTKRVLFTGISPERFFAKGFVFHLPLIKIVPLDDYREFDQELKNIACFDWLVFASRYGVEYFFQRLNKIGADAREFKQAKIAAIGNSTASRLLDFGIVADLTPQEESSRGLLKAFKKVEIRNKKIFMPRSDLSDKGLAQGLKRQGAKVTACPAYRNVIPEDLPELDFSAKKIGGSAKFCSGNFFDEVIFTSPSGVRNFVKRYKKLPPKIKISCIGPVTYKEVKRWRLI